MNVSNHRHLPYITTHKSYQVPTSVLVEAIVAASAGAVVESSPRGSSMFRPGKDPSFLYAFKRLKTWWSQAEYYLPKVFPSKLLCTDAESNVWF